MVVNRFLFPGGQEFFEARASADREHRISHKIFVPDHGHLFSRKGV
jgi:hypothetical protein